MCIRPACLPKCARSCRFQVLTLRSTQAKLGAEHYSRELTASVSVGSAPFSRALDPVFFFCADVQFQLQLPHGVLPMLLFGCPRRPRLFPEEEGTSPNFLVIAADDSP